MLERCGSVTLLLLLFGCSRGPAHAASPDTLVLELGGSNVPLPESMHRLGVQPRPAREETPPASNPPATNPPASDAPAPAPQPSAAPDFIEVKLEKGQSLYELAKKHLGSATRWREIAEFNHIDETRLNKLREGTVIRVPLHKE